MDSDASSLEQRRFIVVTGKGGVGKTTVTAALARALAARGRRVLVAMCNAKERLSEMLGAPPIGPEIVRVAPNIDAVNMLPQRCVEEYGMLILGSRTLYRALFDNRYVQTFFRAVPGLYDWSMLGKAWWHTTELLSGQSSQELQPPYGDSWRYDTVLLDAPATGHGLDMLRVPQVILAVAPPGVLRRDAERAVATFQDGARTAVVVVTLPEEMPTTETLELVGHLRELKLPVGQLVLNGVLEPLLTAPERERLREVSVPPPLEALRDRALRETVQAAAIARLATLQVPTTRLPFIVESDATDPAVVLELSRMLLL